MISLRTIAYALAANWFATTGFAQTSPSQIPPVILVTDQQWEVSGQQISFGEYPLSAGQTPAANAPLNGGTCRAVVAEVNHLAKVVPGSLPIWRNHQATGEKEAYLFRKTLKLGPEHIQKATLEINCDDVARVYINQRLASAEKRDGTIKDGYDDWYSFRSVSGFTYQRIYTYDVTGYFFAHVDNTVLVEATSMAFDGSHAYISAKITIELAPMPAPSTPARTPKPNTTPRPAVPTQDAAGTTVPEKTVFGIGQGPEMGQLEVGSILELSNVYFKADNYQIDAASYPTLAALATFLSQHPSLQVEVGGHTNLRPNAEFAAELSANRARAVVRYLTEQGVAANRMSAKGYGKSQPRVQALSKEADRANQRVEIKVLAK